MAELTGYTELRAEWNGEVSGTPWALVERFRALFLAEGAAMGLLASAVGGLLGGGATFYWSVKGIPIGTAAENAQVAFTTTLYTWFRWDVTLASVAAGTVVAVLASLYPADHAARLDPAQAVRAE